MHTDTRKTYRAAELPAWERAELRARLMASVMDRGPHVAVELRRPTDPSFDPARRRVIVEGVDCGWVTRRDDGPAMDRWHGYVRVPGSTANLVALCRRRRDAAEDVALEALR